MDPFQINQMVWHCADIFKNTQYPGNYPARNIDEMYTDLGNRFHITQEHFQLVKYAMQTRPSKLLKNYRHCKVEGATGKHLKKKANKKGEGSSAAVLTSNMGTLVIFLEYVLSYHAFCKYSWSLPVFLQRSYGNIKAGNRFVVEYFQKLIYRGNNSVDSRFPKIHSQCRMGGNTEEMNTVMNFCCETGERLLKTEAKGISKTAQQRGNKTFLTQTMSRLQDRSILDCFAMYLDEKGQMVESPGGVAQFDRLGRTHPHFLYDIHTDQVYAVNRKYERQPPDEKSGFLPFEVANALRRLEPQMKTFEVYCEVVLRDRSRLRAYPNYSNSGPWYDYANISWEKMDNGVVESYLLPAKCLCFFRKECEQTGVQEIMALIHTAEQYSKGKLEGRMDTLLTRNYRMEFDSRGNPVTHVVPVASIDSSIRCFPHVPGKQLLNMGEHQVTNGRHRVPENPLCNKISG